MFESLILGIVQGVVEWLPVSSEGVLVLVQTQFLQTTLTESLHVALFLHLGTVMAALVYFRSEVREIIGNLFHYQNLEKEDKSQLCFYLISTLVSGVLAFGIYTTIEDLDTASSLGGDVIMIIIGALLLVTGALLLVRKGGAMKDESRLNTKEGFILGITQGLAALPGVSRSGSTVAVLLLRKFNEMTALKASFLMSIPLVLAGNVFLGLSGFQVTPEGLVGFVASFLVGLATIHGLLIFARKVNFGWFVMVFAVLVLGSVLVF